MYDLKSIDTSKFVFNPKDDDFVTRLKTEIPRFAETEIKYERRYFTYLTLMYDKTSPMIKEIPDLFKRKYYCGIAAGYAVVKSGRFKPEYESHIMGGDEEAAELAAAYISYLADSTWLEYQVYLELRANIFREIHSNKKLSATDLGRMTKNINDITSDIKRCESLLFNSGDYDEISVLRNAFYAQAESKRIAMLRPGNVASNINEAGANPYGYYDVDPLKFVGDSKEMAEKKINNGKQRRKTKK